MNLKKAIKIALAQRDLNQKQLCKRAKINEGTLSKTLLNKTNPSVKTIEKIAKAMNMEYSELIALGEGE